MKDGFIRVAAASPDLKVADPVYNRQQMEKQMEEAAKRQVKVLVFPELSITGYTCDDLFWQTPLLEEARRQLFCLAEKTKEMDMMAFAGLPWEKHSRLFNVMAALCHGKVLGLIPKKNLPNY